MPDLRILVVEDIEDDVLLIEHALRQGGYAALLHRVETAADFMTALEQDRWDAVLADWSLPRFGALPALELLRAHGRDLPFIVVTGTASDQTAVAAMKAGAHDIVRKDSLARLAPAIAREVRDAAERAARRAADERYRILVRDFPNGAVLLFDHDLRYTLADGAGLADIGLSKEAFEGRTIWECFPTETVAALEPAYRAALVGTATTYDLPYADRIFEVRILPVAAVDGQISSGMVIATDVTISRQAEAARQAAADDARMRALLIVQVSDAVIGTDLQFRIQSWNPAAERIYGWRADEVIGKLLPEVIPVRRFLDGQALAAVRQAVLDDGRWSGEVIHPHRDGHDLVIDSAVRMIHDEAGTPIGLVGVNRDGTARHQAEQALRRSEAYFRALVEHAGDIISVLNLDGTLRYTSPAQQRVLGQQPDERIGANAFERIHPDDRPQMDQLFARLRSLPGETLSTAVRIQHRDGSWRILEATATNLADDPDITGIVINARDITERKAFEARLIHDAMHDALTNLPNRTLFFNRLSQALDRAARAPERQFGVLFLDLDRFKTINESLGHLLGDQLLQEVAHRLTTCLRPGDSVARLGGDEFALLLEDIESLSVATLISDRIHQVLLAPVQLGEHSLVVSASIGITLSTPGQARPEELLRAADIAMYRAKQLGKARSEVFDPLMLEEALLRLSLEAELRQAIERDDLVLHYQPIVSVAEGTLQGVEALVRWQHPTRGLLPPGLFISIAEETGLIVPLGEWVLRAACKQAAAWRAAGHPSWYIAVNIAALQLKQANLAATLDDILREHGLPPSAIELELTESNAMADPQRTATVLADMRALGIHGVSIDDFGTGYSSLSYLQQFPVTCVKIDRSFVRDLTTNPNSAALARAIIAMAHSLRLTVVAEGVETAAQLALLRSYGCDAAQGYLFSAPLPAAALEQMLHANGLHIPELPRGGRPPGDGLVEAVLADLRAAYLAALLDADQVAANDVIRCAMEQGLSSRGVALQLIQPTAYLIGELWQRKELSVAHEHLATAIMERQLGILHMQATPRRALSRTIVIGAVAGEMHRIGSRMVADAFEEEGWRVFYLGADVPIDEFVRTVREVHPDVIGLSAQRVAQLVRIKATITALKRAGHGAIPVLVGGLPFLEHPELADDVGASGTARNMTDAINLANRLLEASG